MVISEAATLENIGPGTYDVIAEHEAEGCGWNRTFTVFSQDIPEVNLILDDFDFPFCPGTYCLRLDGLANRAGEVMDISWDGAPEFDATNPNEDEPTGICTPYPGLYTVTITSECDSVATYTYEVTGEECNTISGTAYLDYDEDCVYQTGDLGAANYLVTLTNEADGNSYTAYADADGIWSISIPLGTYSITTIVPDGLPLLSCDPTTVILSTNQEPFAPGAASPTVVLEGCNGAPNFSIGFTNLLPLNSGSPGSSLVCRENVGAYDPNDKMGYPLGWDGGNIEPGTKLDYEIRFQNTGTDTAFTVVIRDTLSAALDLSTFRMEAATHDYTVTIDTHRVITWTFNNIMLLDSFTSVPLSQGSVVFSIDHAAALQPGDEILNEAAIYFDFNEPVITNVSRHVIAAEGLPTSVRRVLARSVPLRVFPNPADDRIRLLVEETDLDNTDLVTVTDFLGRPLITLPATQAGGGVDVRTLPPGYYVLVLTDASGRAKGRAAFLVASR